MGQAACCGPKVRQDPRQSNIQMLYDLQPRQILSYQQKVNGTQGQFTMTRSFLVKSLNFSEKEALSIFAKFDEDGLGYIDTYELFCAMILCADATFDQKAQMLFSLYDQNKNSTLEVEEVQTLVKSSQNALCYLGNIQNRPTQDQVERDIQVFFKQADIDQDSKITFQELKAYLKSDKNLLRLYQQSGASETSQDLGKSFGASNSDTPVLDDDLEAECQPFGSKRDKDTLLRRVQIIENQPIKYETQWSMHRAKYEKPDNYKFQEVKAPDQNLTLEHVYGYRCSDTRNNVRFNAAGNVVYHASGLGIILDTRTNMQTFMQAHKEDILSFAMNEERTLAVTGEQGQNPRLCLWNAITGECIFEIRKPLIKGIRHVCFSSDGLLVGASDLTEDHTIAVYQVSQNQKSLKLIAQGKSLRNDIMSIGFNQTNSALVATCVKAVAFFNWNQGKISMTMGSGWSNDGPDTIMTQAHFDNLLVTGSNSGELVAWNSVEICSRKKDAHKGKIECILAPNTNSMNFFTAGIDGQIKQWQLQRADNSVDFVLLGTSDLQSLCKDIQPEINCHIRSIDFDKDTYLIGTRGGEIIKLGTQNSKPQVLLRSHSENRLCGLTINKQGNCICTLDKSGKLCMWDANQHTLTRSFDLQIGGLAIEFTNNGQHLAIGQYNGELLVLEFSTFEPLYNLSQDRPNYAIQVISYSQNDQYCAVGAYDKKVFVYNCTQDYRKIRQIQMQSVPIALDWSFKADVIRAQDANSVLIHCDIKQGKNLQPKDVRNEKWQTWTCSQGWAVHGIWPQGSQGNDITSVERHPNGNLIAVGDDYGQVKLFNYPVCNDQDPYNLYTGHGYYVSNMKFTQWQNSAEQFLFTTGGEDKCLFQWRYSDQPTMADTRSSFNASQSRRPTSSIFRNQREESISISEMTVKRQKTVTHKQPTQFPKSIQQQLQRQITEAPNQLERKLTKAETLKQEKLLQQLELDNDEAVDIGFQDLTVTQNDALFDEEKQDAGDQALAVKPWKSAVDNMVPTNFVKPRGNAPVKADMELKWAFGFRSFDMYDNLWFNNEGNFVYNTAGVGIVQNSQAKVMKFFNEHKEDIVALAYNKKTNLVATGQVAAKDLTDKTIMNRGRQKLKEGKLVNIFIWNAETCEQVGPPIKGLHRRQILLLDFSNDGTMLMSIGADDKHHMGVYIIDQTGKKAHSLVGQGTPINDKPLRAQWSPKGDYIAVVTAKQILQCFVSNDVKIQNRIQQVKDDDQVVCGVVATQYDEVQEQVIDQKMVTGGKRGQLYVWQGKQKDKLPSQHTKRINVIKRGKNSQFYTCCEGGQIFLWQQLKMVTMEWNISASSIPYALGGITALDVTDEGKMLIGTSCAMVIQRDGDQCAVVNQGHFKDKTMRTYAEIWGCVTHPEDETIFATAGADRRIRVWKYERDTSDQDGQITKTGEKKILMETKQLEVDVTSLDWSKNGQWICAGDREATISIYKAEDLSFICKVDTKQAEKAKKHGRNSRVKSWKTEQWVEVCKFSPDMAYVAFGHHGYGTKISVSQFDQASGKLGNPHGEQLSSALMHLDWSLDSQSILTTDTSYEVRLFDVVGGRVKRNGYLRTKRDEVWQSWSSNLGWPVQGIYGKCADLTEINTVMRSNNHQIIATGWDTGEIKLTNWPCIDPKAKNQSYYGHSAHVTKVMFSSKDDFLMSTGGGDMTVFVWDTSIGNINTEDDLDSLEKPRSKTDLSKQRRAQAHQNDDEENHVGELFAEEMPGAGDESGACKPWIGQMKPPTNYKKKNVRDLKPPRANIQIEHVHGYRGYDSRNNLQYLKDNRICYYVAGVMVVHDPETNTQKHFAKHLDDVSCITFHPSQNKVVTGELGRRPSAYIIDIDKLGPDYTPTHIKGLQHSIIAASYSPSGNSLALLSGDEHHTCAVYDVSGNKPQLKKSQKTYKEDIFDIEMKDDNVFVVCGVKLFAEVDTQATGRRAAKKGVFNSQLTNQQQILTCSVFRDDNKDCLTANMSGQIIVWSGTSIKQVVKVFEKRIDSIRVVGDHILVGGKQKIVKVLSLNYETLFEVDLSAVPNTVCTEIRAIDLQNNKLLVGTFGCEILSVPITIDSKSSGEATVLMHGHYAPGMPTNEVWGLAAFPNGTRYATCSDDATIRIWDSATRKQVDWIDLTKSMEPNEEYKMEKQGRAPHNAKWPVDAVNKYAKGRSMAICSQGKYMAIGTFGGLLRVFEDQQGKFVEIANCEIKHNDKQNKKSNRRAKTRGMKFEEEWIEDLKFDKDCNFLAVTSHNNRVFLFKYGEFTDYVTYFGKSSSFITHLDFSLDGKNVRTNDGASELLYYNLDNPGDNDKYGASAHKDTHWQTNTCVLAFDVMGMWQSGMDKTDINKCGTNNKGAPSLLAAADDRGKVCVYNYPCYDFGKNAPHLTLWGHSSHVANVTFDSEDNYIFSVGGNDTSVIQWKVTK